MAESCKTQDFKKEHHIKRAFSKVGRETVLHSILFLRKEFFCGQMRDVLEHLGLSEACTKETLSNWRSCQNLSTRCCSPCRRLPVMVSNPFLPRRRARELGPAQKGLPLQCGRVLGRPSSPQSVWCQAAELNAVQAWSPHLPHAGIHEPSGYTLSRTLQVQENPS